jgi:hypothetical protein
MHFCMGLMAELCSSAASDSLFFFNFLLPSRCSTRPPGSITLVSFSDSLSAQPLEHRATGRTCPSTAVPARCLFFFFFLSFTVYWFWRLLTHGWLQWTGDGRPEPPRIPIPPTCASLRVGAPSSDGCCAVVEAQSDELRTAALLAVVCEPLSPQDLSSTRSLKWFCNRVEFWR